MNHVTIRLEEEKDYREVELLIREAFWREDRISKIGIGCDEHYLAHTSQASKECIPELDFVAEIDGRLVGNVMCSKAHVKLPDGARHNVLNFGPLSVLPELKRHGIGSVLVRHSLKTAAKVGYGSVIFFEHAAYYPRFGFK